ncbi:MAG: type II secretion system major pseudopilin GspG [Caulobacterales bacterium]|nr:type II secretion system major pseudopilin GspG [Caulobacterales bacterium]
MRSATPTAMRAPADAGLTLLELLVVITILVLLSVAVGTVALNYLGRAKSDAAGLQLNQIEAGLDLFRLDVGRYPTEQEGLEALIANPGGLDRWKGPYVRKAETLTDPWGAPFHYAFPGQGGDFDIYSYGSDGEPGGADEAGDVTN